MTDRSAEDRPGSRTAPTRWRRWFELKRGLRDEDVYGRKMRTLSRNGKSLGRVLVEEGLAESWVGFRRNWCA